MPWYHRIVIGWDIADKVALFVTSNPRIQNVANLEINIQSVTKCFKHLTATNLEVNESSYDWHSYSPGAWLGYDCSIHLSSSCDAGQQRRAPTATFGYAPRDAVRPQRDVDGWLVENIFFWLQPKEPLFLIFFGGIGK